MKKYCEECTKEIQPDEAGRAVVIRKFDGRILCKEDYTKAMQALAASARNVTHDFGTFLGVSVTGD